MDESYLENEFYAYEEGQDFEDAVGDVVLPYQGEDWEFANDSHHPTRYLESINVNLEDQVPLSLRELATFYYNPLLERSDLYADQFIENSSNFNPEFERLLKVFEKSTEALFKLEIDEEDKNKSIQALCQNIFDTKPEQIKAEGHCQDQYKVSTVHRYNQCCYNESVASELKLAIADAQRHSTEDSSLALYTRTLSQLQCVQFLCDAATNVRYHMKKMTTNTDSVKSSLLVKLADESADVIRQCINTMFKFVRKNDDCNESFSQYLRAWITNLVHLLYELAEESGYQHLAGEEQYILNHVIRSPPNTQSWAAQLVQISFPATSDTIEQKFFIDHIIYLLFLILRAPKGREQFLRESKSLVKMKSLADDSNDWIFVEDSGDYLTKGVGSQWHILPKESDMVSLYQQIPFEKMLSQILSLEIDEQGNYSFKDNDANSSKLLHVLACCDVMCDILGEGLATLGTPKYKQLVRRIGQTLRNIVILVSKYWNFYKEKVVNCPQRHSNVRLQTEFDEFVKRCVERLLAVAQLGVYQFLADLPFKDVSSKAAETIYVLMNVPAGSRAEVDHLVATRYSRQEWLDFIQDSDTKLAFEDHLSSMPENEIIYLLTTFCNLACSQPKSEDHLVNIIALDIYTISFVYSSTRDICCKTGRELLCSLASTHPFMISTVLQHVNASSDEISVHAYYAIADLPYNLWCPVKEDLDVLRLWILNSAMPTVYGKLVPVILKGLNLGKKDNGILFLSHNFHCDISLMLLEICRLHEVDANESGMLVKGIDKVSRIAYSMRTSLSIDARLQAWVWDVLLRLKLHRSHLKSSETSEYLDQPTPLIGFNEDVLLSKSLSEQRPEACYIAIMMTNLGHSLNVFLQQGIPIFKVLAESKHRNATVQCLATVVNMFVKGGIDLSINSAFVDALRICLASERSVINDITNKIIESELSIPQHLQLLMGFIAEHLESQSCDTVLSYWLKLILNVPSWWEDDAFKIVLDFVLKCAFNSTPECSYMIQEIIYSKHLELMTAQKEKPSPKHQNRSVISSFLTYVGAENSDGMLSFLQNLSVNFSYLSYYILACEEHFENDMHLWTSIVSLATSNSVQSSVKKSASSLKLGYKLHPSQLTIYRWADLLLLSRDDCPILPVVCQKFFQRFIYVDKSTGSSAGQKFFTSAHGLEIINKLKRKFSSLSTSLVDKNVHGADKKLLDLYRTFEVWLEEEKLHDTHLYLPSLPSHYQPDLLAAVRTQNQSLWSQFVNYNAIHEEIQQLLHSTLAFFSENVTSHPSSSTVHRSSNLKISYILKQFEPPVAFDLTSSTEMSFPILVNQLTSSSAEDLCDSIKSDVKSLLSHAQYFTGLVAKLDVLNMDYLELLPDLYSNEEQRRLIKIECQSAFSPTHSCAGPAQVQLQFYEKTLNDIMSERLKKNREKYRSSVKSISDEAASEDFGFSAIHVISVVKALIEKLKSPLQRHDDSRSLMECGANLFFELADLNSDERWKYPPTRHLLLTSIDLLGQTFIFGHPHQAVPLLEQMLKRPEMAAVLSTHFSPGSSCQRVIGGSSLHSEFDTGIFSQMYQRIVTASESGNNSDVLFVLITKFDLESWCIDYNPPKCERQSLLQSIVTGLKFQYMRPSSLDTNSAGIAKSFSMQLSNSAVQEVFITHLSLLLKYSANLIFFEAIRLLLIASKEMKIDPKVWDAVVDSDILSDCSTSTSIQISYDCVDTCIKHVAVFFSDERKNSQTASLYSQWNSYIPSLAKLLHHLIMFEIDSNEKMRSTGQVQSQNHVLVRDRILPLFTPWIAVTRTIGKANPILPWSAKEQIEALPILNAVTSLVNEICATNTWDIPQCVTSLWMFYLDNTLIEVNEVAPEYIISSYQSINSELPWESFIPNLADLDKMVQLCHTNINCVLHYLCHVFPKINWFNIIGMCKANDTETTTWVDHTGEILSYFLQILLYLGSDENRLKTYQDLEILLSSAQVFPWHLVGFDEFELLANVTTDRYNALCGVFFPADTRLQSSCYAVFKLLQTASGIPLIENDSHHFLWKDVENNPTLIQTMWMKRQSFVRCVGNLIRNTLKAQSQKDKDLLETVTAALIERLLQSILIIVKHDSTVNETVLAELFCEFWKCISRFHVKLQDIVISVMLKFLGKLVPFHDGNLEGDTSDSCRYLHLVLICNLSASLHNVSDPKILSALSEQSFSLCLLQYRCSLAQSTAHESPEKDLDLTLWTSLRHTLLEYGKLPQANFLQAALADGCVLSLLAVSQNLFDNTETLKSSEKISLQGLTHLLVEWISKITPKHDQEHKILLFVAFLFKVCHKIELDTQSSPDSSNLNFIAENLAILIPIFEQWGIDRVKYGILGSLGIGRPSQLSVGFRISIRLISCSILAIVCRLQPNYEETSKKLEASVSSLKKLPSTTQIYREEGQFIDSLLSIMQAPSQGNNELISKIFSFYFPEHCHMLPLLQ